jgi:hypothetical protein
MSDKSSFKSHLRLFRHTSIKTVSVLCSTFVFGEYDRVQLAMDLIEERALFNDIAAHRFCFVGIVNIRYSVSQVRLSGHYLWTFSGF